MDRDEPRFAQATVEMMERDTWVVPFFNDEYRFDKPPLVYWWIRLHYHLMGVGELAARLHSIVSAYLVALVIGGLSRRLTGSSRAGFFGGGLWLTTTQVLIHGRLCVADMPMILFVTLSCRALVELLCFEQQARRRLWWWTLWLSLGLGFLAKGPVAWFMPVLTLVFWRLVFRRQPGVMKRLELWPGFLVMLAPVVAWGIPALVETQGLFWKVGVGQHVVQRGVEVLNGRRFVPGYYLLTTWLSLYPWLFFWRPVFRVIREKPSDANTFLASWFMASQVLFFFYATQLPHYVMPGYPAFITLLAMAWYRPAEDRQSSSVSYLLPGLGAMVCILCLPVWMIHEGPPEMLRLMRIASLLLTVLFTGAAVSACAAWKSVGADRWVVPILFIGATAVLLPCFGNSLKKSSVTLSLVKSLDAFPGSARLLATGYDEPSLVFYTNRSWRTGLKLAEMQRAMALPGPCAAVFLQREWSLQNAFMAWFDGGRIVKPVRDKRSECEAVRASFPDYESHSIEGFNVARASWSEVIVFMRRN